MSKATAELILANHLHIPIAKVQSDPQLQQAVDAAVIAADRKAQQRVEQNRYTPYADRDPNPNNSEIYNAVAEVAPSIRRNKPQDEERQHSGRWDDPRGVWAKRI